MGKNKQVTSSRASVLPTLLALAAFGGLTASAQTEIAAVSLTPFSAWIAAPAPVSSSSLSDLPDAPSAELQEAQQPPAPPPNETDEQRKERERLEGEEQVRRQEHQRNFGVIPNFNTVIGGKVLPLTRKEKLDVVFHTIRDPYTFALAGVVAGLGELNPPNQGYGWGPSGYGYRYGTAYADNVDGAFLGNAILPILLHQDPRYFRKGTGPIKSRILYSALSTVLCRGDNGNRQVNFSNILGNMIAGGISNIYYPHEQRGYGLIFSNGLTVTAEGAVGAQLLEFAPDISAAMHRRAERKRAQKQLNSPGANVTPAHDDL
jgi:hypothetical protein